MVVQVVVQVVRFQKSLVKLRGTRDTTFTGHFSGAHPFKKPLVKRAYHGDLHVSLDTFFSGAHPFKKSLVKRAYHGDLHVSLDTFFFRCAPV